MTPPVVLLDRSVLFCQPEPKENPAMPAARRAPVVALLTLLERRFPGLDDPARLIKEGAVLVNGVPAASLRTRVRADAVIRIHHPRCGRPPVSGRRLLTE